MASIPTQPRRSAIDLWNEPFVMDVYTYNYAIAILYVRIHSAKFRKSIMIKRRKNCAVFTIFIYFMFSNDLRMIRWFFLSHVELEVNGRLRKNIIYKKKKCIIFSARTIANFNAQSFILIARSRNRKFN